jgi:predicted nucleic acid-binding protein
VSGFLDTNILVHAFTRGPLQQKARDLLYTQAIIGVQSLNEFTLVARRRLGLAWPEIHAALLFIRQRCAAPVPLTLSTHLDGLRLAERHQLQIYDSMLLAAALAARCSIFWSQDMHDGLAIDGRLTIRNPFA